MKRNRRSRRPIVTVDGEGLVSRAGVALLRELTDETGLAAGWTAALLDTYKTSPAVHAPGRVLADLAVVIADGGDALTHLATLRDQDKLFGVVASDATAWRCVERVDDAHLDRLRAVRAHARARAWAAGAGPDLSAGLVIDFVATLTIAHSEKENAASTWKKTFGFHPLLAYLDRPDISGGEGLAGILPCKSYAMNKVWLELELTAADLLSWMQKLCLTGELAHCEPAALRYRLLHVAARVVRTGRRGHLKIDRDWPWAENLATAFARLRAAPWPTRTITTNPRTQRTTRRGRQTGN